MNFDITYKSCEFFGSLCITNIYDDVFAIEVGNSLPNNLNKA